jgi:hypothetical protein
MINYKETSPHLVYEEGNVEELEMIDEAIRKHILKWDRPAGKDFYITEDGQYIHTIFQPTRRHSDAMYLFTKFDNIELEKEGDRYYACIYTGLGDYEGELILFVESPRYELAISLAAYESIKHFG